MNYLEQLVAEWYDYNGYLVRKNVRARKRASGGFDNELDVIAFQPERKRFNSYRSLGEYRILG